jgi:hypothetical protein
MMDYFGNLVMPMFIISRYQLRVCPSIIVVVVVVVVVVVIVIIIIIIIIIIIKYLT